MTASRFRKRFESPPGGLCMMSEANLNLKTSPRSRAYPAGHESDWHGNVFFSMLEVVRILFQGGVKYQTGTAIS